MKRKVHDFNDKIMVLMWLVITSLSDTSNEDILPESEGHGVEASLHIAEEHAGGLHLQPVLLTGVPLINGGPLASIPGLGRGQEHRNISIGQSHLAR